MVLVFDAREATRDVDAVRVDTLDRASFDSSVRQVAGTLALAPDWLNDRVRAFTLGLAPGPVVFSGRALSVRAVAFEQLLAMKLSALRDDVDYDDAATVLARMSGDRESVWRSIEPYLVPGQETWKRQNFDALWKDVHGTR